MAKRIFDLAKEIGITSKAIIDKCIAEGVPVETVKTHMSPVKAGLEASIREWFAAAASGGGTAVETSAHIDVETVKSKVRRKTAKAVDGDKHDDHSEADHAVRSDPAVTTQDAETAQPASAVALAPAAGTNGEHINATNAAQSTKITQTKPEAAIKVEQAPRLAPAAVEFKPTPASASISGPQVISRAAAPHAPPPGRPTYRQPAAPVSPAPALAAPMSTPVRRNAFFSTTDPLAGTNRPAHVPQIIGPIARTPETSSAVEPVETSQVPTETILSPDSGSPAPEDLVVPGATPPPPNARIEVPARYPRGVTPAPVNVPSRPKSVAPAGTVLVKQQVKLTGPKVIRVEAAEPVTTPRPARSGLGNRGPSVGGGVRSGVGGADRTPRRNDRRTVGPDPAAGRNKRNKGGEEVPNSGVFRAQDLVEREERLAKAGGYLKQRRRELRAREGAADSSLDQETSGKVQIEAPFTIKELAEASGVRASEIIKKLFLQGIIATVNVAIDPARAQEIMIDFDLELEVVTKKTAEEEVSSIFVDRAQVDIRPRPPVVTIMGHVDHGKTSLLDKIRRTNVAAGEAGGITQKTSAFRVSVDVNGESKNIVFLDTPGHQAFTEMRARGANLTDIIVLVVSAADGVMPQTIESINHSKAAKVPIVIALNKIDSPQATESQIQKIYGQLAEQGLSPQEWGGTTELIKTSATRGDGIKELLETLDLQAQVLELKAGFGGSARGRVVEAARDEGRGPLATVLIQEGELKVGDFIVVGRAFGRVRDIADDQGKRIKVAGPSMPVVISGMDQVPDAGDPFFVTATLRQAEEAADGRRMREREEHLQQPKVTLDSLLGQMKDAAVKEILIVLKADVQGSVDVIQNEVERLSTDEVKIRVLHAAVGGINESDVQLAQASKAVIVGFNVIPSSKARGLAEQKSVEIRTYQVIYDITEDVKKAASGLLEPEIRQEILGHAEVRKVFSVSRVGTIAGCYVTDGQVQRDALIRVTRNGVVIVNDRILEQLKRFKDDAKEVKANMECGMKIVGYDDIKEGDVLECYKKVEIKRTL